MGDLMYLGRRFITEVPVTDITFWYNKHRVRRSRTLFWCPSVDIRCLKGLSQSRQQQYQHFSEIRGRDPNAIVRQLCPLFCWLIDFDFFVLVFLCTPTTDTIVEPPVVTVIV